MMIYLYKGVKVRDDNRANELILHKKILGLKWKLMQTGYLYWIHSHDETEKETQGYIGVSQDADKRFRTHLKDWKMSKDEAVLELSLIHI